MYMYMYIHGSNPLILLSAILHPTIPSFLLFLPTIIYIPSLINLQLQSRLFFFVQLHKNVRFEKDTNTFEEQFCRFENRCYKVAARRKEEKSIPSFSTIRHFQEDRSRSRFGSDILGIWSNLLKKQFLSYRILTPLLTPSFPSLSHACHRLDCA